LVLIFFIHDEKNGLKTQLIPFAQGVAVGLGQVGLSALVANSY
jgi:hypothetical protein